jgi:hypothetical protein
MLMLRRELLANDDDADPLDVLLKFTGHPDLVASIQRVQATAAFVQWIRVSAMDGEKPSAGTTEAVSLLLTGIDNDADEAAIETARGGQDADGCGLPHPDVVFDELRTEVRPCLATLCISPQSPANPALKAACEALAQAFFEVLGVEGDKSEFERRRP